MIYAHSLDPNEFTGRTQLALRKLLQPSWVGTNIAEVNNAFDGLYERHGWIAAKSDLGVSDPACVEIRKVIHALADVWADLWFQRGEDKFREKLRYYYRMARFDRSNAHDELLYQALNRVLQKHNPDPDDTAEA